MDVIYYGISGKEMRISQSDVKACEARKKSVENVMAIMLSATNGPDEFRNFYLYICMVKF